MTATANGLLSVDGFATIAGNRILVYSGVTVPQTGIYVVTQAGTAGTPWILTRAADCCDGLTIFNDIAVKITTGTVWGGTAFAARCIDNATSSLKHSTFVVETDYMFWDQIPSTITTDMLVVKWHDGSETVLAQSPPYFV
jgi:hypothetical protein